MDMRAVEAIEVEVNETETPEARPERRIPESVLLRRLAL
jgi:hypothetical protein